MKEISIQVSKYFSTPPPLTNHHYMLCNEKSAWLFRLWPTRLLLDFETSLPSLSHLTNQSLWINVLIILTGVHWQDWLAKYKMNVMVLSDWHVNDCFIFDHWGQIISTRSLNNRQLSTSTTSRLVSLITAKKGGKTILKTKEIHVDFTDLNSWQVSIYN